MAYKTYFEGVTEVTECETASEFLDFLQIRNERWLPRNATTSPWIFRGQRKADMQLVPKAMRCEFVEFVDYKEQFRTKVQETVNKQIALFKSSEYQPNVQPIVELVLQVYAERLAIQEFVNLADQIGHSIPEDKRTPSDEVTLQHVIGDLAPMVSTDATDSYIPEGIESALAQHHGIPTRLLDWTSLTFASAFFAAEDVIKKNEGGDYEIAVWAINRVILDEEMNANYKSPSSLRVVTQRRAQISYLHAQGSLFIYDKMANKHFLKNGIWRSFEEAIETDFSAVNVPILRKIVLPAKHSSELLRLLSAENVTRAHLMPTFDNVTETLRTRRLLESYSPNIP